MSSVLEPGELGDPSLGVPGPPEELPEQDERDEPTLINDDDED